MNKNETIWNWTCLMMTLQSDIVRLRLRCERTACRNSDRLSSPDRSLSNTSQTTVTKAGGAWWNKCRVLLCEGGKRNAFEISKHGRKLSEVMPQNPTGSKRCTMSLPTHLQRPTVKMCDNGNAWKCDLESSTDASKPHMNHRRQQEGGDGKQKLSSRSKKEIT